MISERLPSAKRSLLVESLMVRSRARPWISCSLLKAIMSSTLTSMVWQRHHRFLTVKYSSLSFASFDFNCAHLVMVISSCSWNMTQLIDTHREMRSDICSYGWRRAWSSPKFSSLLGCFSPKIDLERRVIIENWVASTHRWKMDDDPVERNAEHPFFILMMAE